MILFKPIRTRSAETGHFFVRSHLQELANGVAIGNFRRETDTSILT